MGPPFISHLPKIPIFRMASPEGPGGGRARPPRAEGGGGPGGAPCRRRCRDAGSGRWGWALVLEGSKNTEKHGKMGNSIGNSIRKIGNSIGKA